MLSHSFYFLLLSAVAFTHAKPPKKTEIYNAVSPPQALGNSSVVFAGRHTPPKLDDLPKDAWKKMNQTCATLDYTLILDEMILGGDPNCKSVELGAKKEGEKGVARLEVCNWDVCGKVNITSLSPFCHALARPFEGIGRKPYTESWKLDHNPSATVNIRIDNTISEIPQILDFKPKCNGFEIPEDGTLDKEKKHEDNSWVRGAKKMLRPYVPGRCQMEKECKIIRLEGLAGFEVIEETMVDEVMLEDFEWDLQLFG